MDLRAGSKSAAAIDRARAQGRAALICYIPAGYPDVQSTIDAGIALARNGADLIEIGIPYSDPVMDGAVIQAATTEAIANGFRVSSVFDIVAAITAATDAAVLVMTYWNPVLRRGVDRFAAALAAAALAGLYSNAMKRVFALPRPASVLDPSRLHVIGETLHANSFPSGHAVTVFTLAALLVLASKKPIETALWAVPFAVLIAVSRIAVGAHWPADIAAGAAGGWVCGAVGVAIVARWRFWNTTAGVRVMGVIAIGIGVSLFIVDLGYPLAVPLQDVAAVIAIASGIVAIARPRLDRVLPHRAIDT